MCLSKQNSMNSWGSEGLSHGIRWMLHPWGVSSLYLLFSSLRQHHSWCGHYGGEKNIWALAEIEFLKHRSRSLMSILAELSPHQSSGHQLQW